MLYRINTYRYIHTCVYMYIYIYIYREREREIDRKSIGHDVSCSRCTIKSIGRGAARRSNQVGNLKINFQNPLPQKNILFFVKQTIFIIQNLLSLLARGCPRAHQARQASLGGTKHAYTYIYKYMYIIIYNIIY